MYAIRPTHHSVQLWNSAISSHTTILSLLPVTPTNFSRRNRTFDQGIEFDICHTPMRIDSQKQVLLLHLQAFLMWSNFLWTFVQLNVLVQAYAECICFRSITILLVCVCSPVEILFCCLIMLLRHVFDRVSAQAFRKPRSILLLLLVHCRWCGCQSGISFIQNTLSNPAWGGFLFYVCDSLLVFLRQVTQQFAIQFAIYPGGWYWQQKPFQWMCVVNRDFVGTISHSQLMQLTSLLLYQVQTSWRKASIPQKPACTTPSHMLPFP